MEATHYNNDWKLWKSFKEGNYQSFEKVYQLYIDELLNYGYRVTSDKQLIRDSIQDLFIHLWNSKENLSNTTSIRFYLFRSLRNRILRNANLHGIVYTSTLENTITDEDFQELPIEELIIASEQESHTKTELQKAIQKLPSRQQEILQLKFYHNFSNEEISHIMQISNQSVRNLLHRTLHHLRILLEPIIGVFLTGLNYIMIFFT